MLIFVADSKPATGVIDPAWDGHIILAEAQKRGWRIGIFGTHMRTSIISARARLPMD